MKEELIKLAKEKGFACSVKYMPTFLNAETGEIDEGKLKSFVDTANYLCLCEIKQWLIKTHRISVEVGFEPNSKPVGYWECDVLEMDKPWYHSIEKGFNSDTKALERGISEALKLIK